MGRMAWASTPPVAVVVSIPDPPQTDNPALNDWMQRAKQAMEAQGRGNAELSAFLDDVLDAIKDLDRDSLSQIATIADTADATYSANEQTMLGNLKTAVNALIAAL